MIKNAPCDQQLKDRATFSYLLSMWRLEDERELEQGLEAFKKNAGSENLKQKVYLLGAMKDKKWNKFLSKENLKKSLSWQSRLEKDQPSNDLSFSTISHEYRSLNLKSPALAGSLSILPGLGQLYNGSFEAAAISFILNGVLAAATYEFIDDDKHAAAVASGIVFSVTYLGNIISAANGASKINQAKIKKLDRKYEREFLGLTPP